jgi:glycosyltransferase involved in cell wall biosynthesis
VTGPASPTLAAVIPARRTSAETLRRTLASALAQGRELAEVVIVDDDGPGQPLREVLDPLPPVVRIVETAGLGAGGARNAGMRSAHADWVAFLDSDDLWCEGYAARLRATISRDADAAACFCAAWHVSDAGEVMARFEASSRHATKAGLLLRKLQPTVSATAVNRLIALEAGGFHEGFEHRAGVQDIDLWWRLAAGRRCLVQPTPLARYVVHEHRDRNRTRAELAALSRDRTRCIDRIRGAVPRRMFRHAAAQHRAIMARYWLLAGYGRQGLWEAAQSLAWLPTVNGIGAFGLALVPSRGRHSIRSLRRRLMLARSRSTAQ